MTATGEELTSLGRVGHVYKTTPIILIVGVSQIQCCTVDDEEERWQWPGVDESELITVSRDPFSTTNLSDDHICILPSGCLLLLQPARVL